ncbi:T-complex protein 1 subunit beta, partial [Tanacetum coccineum]
IASSVNSTFNEESLGGLSVFKNVGKSTKDGVLGTAAAPIHMVATEGDLNSTFGLSQVERLFKDEATEEKGERAIMASFVGAMAIADLVKTTLGPKGMVKLLQSTEKFRSDLMKIAMTTLSSKILSQDKEHFTTLAIAAVMSLKGSPKLESIQIIKKAGGSLKDSFDTVLKLDYHSSVYSCQLNMYVGNSFTFRRGDITMLDINLFVISHEKHTGTKIITYH